MKRSWALLSMIALALLAAGCGSKPPHAGGLGSAVRDAAAASIANAALRQGFNLPDQGWPDHEYYVKLSGDGQLGSVLVFRPVNSFKNATWLDAQLNVDGTWTVGCADSSGKVWEIAKRPDIELVWKSEGHCPEPEYVTAQ